NATGYRQDLKSESFDSNVADAGTPDCDEDRDGQAAGVRESLQERELTTKGEKNDWEERRAQALSPFLLPSLL
ncbi:leucine-rich repeat-containing protein 24-like X2, partial [Biomphalaria pfeifferi]